MEASQLVQVDGAVAGAWIRPALGEGFGGLVKQQVPQIYDAYARIFHPASDEEGNEVTWGEVAERLGTTAHREMQWHAIVGSYDYTNFAGSRWPGGDPSRAELEDTQLDALCAILALHTATPERCFFGLSTIHGGVEEEFPDAPLLEMTHRDFAVLAGPLSAVDRIALGTRHGAIMIAFREGEELPPDWEPPERFLRQAPNLIWPEDRGWFVATECDFDSTLVGGGRDLIEAILAAPELEAWEVDGEVSLQCDADTLNPVPDPPPGFGEPQDPDKLQRDFFTEMLSHLNGEIVAAGIEGGELAIDVKPERGARWRLEAHSAQWSLADPAALLSRRIESVELDSDTDTLLCSLSGGRRLEVSPPERAGEEDEPPSWRVRLPAGLTLRHGPGLIVEFDDSKLDEAERS